MAHHVLTDKLELLALSFEVKAALRETLSSAAAYRSAMGEPHVDDQTGAIRHGKPSDQVDLTWRSALGILGNLCLEFVEACGHTVFLFVSIGVSRQSAGRRWGDTNLAQDLVFCNTSTTALSSLTPWMTAVSVRGGKPPRRSLRQSRRPGLQSQVRPGVGSWRSKRNVGDL